MKGVLVKTFMGWYISYDDVTSSENDGKASKKTIPLSLKEPYNVSFLKTFPGDDFQEIDFEIIDEYIEPEGTHSNRGYFKKFAKLLK